jgi:MarR family transcriptional regulator, 2-MHQ and catechol-resistance regulon repressor
MARSAGTRAALLQHPLLTTGGLFVEAHAGIADRVERRLEAESGLSMQWFEVLIRLARSPGKRLRMTDLAAQTVLSPSGLTRAVDRMVDAELVTREACPTDRRSTYAVLSPEGERRVLKALPVHVAHLEDVFEMNFSPEEIETFTELLRRLRDATNPCAAQASTPEGLGDVAPGGGC